MNSLTFTELLQKKIISKPDYKIFNYSGKWFTWKNIEEYSTVMALDLQKLGVTKGSHVGILTKTSINWIISFFAIQKIGAVSVLLNDLFSDYEVERTCSEADVVFLCTDRNYIPPENSSVKFIYDISDKNNFAERIVQFAEELNSAQQNISFPKLSPEEKTIILFTSGTTGKEKAILLSLSNLTIPSPEVCSSFENHCFMSALPLFHILGFMNILLALFTENTTLVLAPEIIPDSILQLIEEYKCSAMFSVPTLLLGIAESHLLTENNSHLLKTCILGGSSIMKQQLEFIHKKLPDCKLVSGYGMTETAVITMTDFDESDEILCTSIGRPFKEICLKIADTVTGKECEPGVTGELLVKGSNLKAEYYNSKETKLYDEEGFIHSGDLAYRDEKGYFYITGRIKNLIIRGGENILPSELVSAIAKYPSVKNVEIISLPDRFYGEVAGAAVILKNGEFLEKEKLVDFLKTLLSVNKIPKYFVVYKAFPLLANGKTNLCALREDMLIKTGISI